ncbi:MAG: ATP-binding protein [Desulfuromonadaceae bacterium]|nr:ATP-binding protein [Desulfuromonas sp.]MDY0184312.1 ATP-binding protein [Desulfuromonadaceae bacterium]
MLKNSLIVRIIAMNVVLLTFGIGVFAMFHYQRDRSNMLKLTRDGAEILMVTVVNSIFNSKCQGDPEKLQHTLELIADGPSLRIVRIFNPVSGIVANSSFAAELGQPMLSSELEAYRRGDDSVMLDYDGEDVLSILHPIRNKEVCHQCHSHESDVLGVLNLNYSIATTNELLNNSSRCFSLSMIFITLLLSVGVACILVRYVRKPIQVITRRMARVEAGEKNIRMAPKYNDEIAYLMRSFNSMLDKLEAAQLELEQYHFQQMEQADRLAAIGEMATGMAHEIKNPLAGIKGALPLIAEDFPAGDERLQVVNDIMAQIERLNKTATDLLKFGRPGIPQFDYLDVNDVICETLFFVAQHPEAKKVEQRRQLGHGLPLIWADCKQLQQVLLNILINALQAAPAGGHVSLSTTQIHEGGRDCVQIEIADDGAGIPESVREKVFTPFFTTKNRGTGLGLPICKQLVKQNNGRITVHSSSGGTTFTLVFPVAGTFGTTTAESENQGVE